MIQLARAYRQKPPVIRVRLHRVRRDGKAGRSFEVDLGRVGSKRQRISFQTRRDASNYAKQYQMTLATEGKQGVLLSEDLRVDAKRSQKRLEEAGHKVSIEDCVEFYLSKNGNALSPKTIEAVISELEERLQREKRSVGHIKLLGWRLRSLFKNDLQRDIKTITRENILSLNDQLAQDKSLSVDSMRGYFTYTKCLFAFAVNEKYCSENPLKGVKKPEQPDDLPDRILTLDQVCNILKAAYKIQPDLIPAIAIQLYAGLRVSECLRLDWVEVKQGQLLVRGRKSKSRQNRYVTIHPVLESLLSPHRRESGFVVPKGYREKIERIREGAGITEWPRNAFRHTFASNHAAHFKDAALTSGELGHACAHTLFKHYRSLVTKEVAEKYWE